jgi:hypothetical protein
MVRVKIAPDIEFNMEIDLEGITRDSNDYDVQKHKKEVYDAFVARLRKAFANSEIRVKTFEFGLDRSEIPEPVV